MLENDYIMRMIILYIKLLKAALGQRHKDPREAAADLERQIGEIVDIDAGLFFSLTGESMAIMLQLGNTDERLMEYLIRGMALSAVLLEGAGNEKGAEQRRTQISALIHAFDLNITDSDLSEESIEVFVQAAEDDS